MKKIMLAVLTACTLLWTLSASATADRLPTKGSVIIAGCDYTERMRIQGPEGSRILELTANGIQVQQLSDLEFRIVGTCDGGHDGYVIAKIGTDSDHFTELKIVDAQHMWNPEVYIQKSVGGFSYIGKEHQFGSYEYTLIFSK